MPVAKLSHSTMIILIITNAQTFFAFFKVEFNKTAYICSNFLSDEFFRFSRFISPCQVLHPLVPTCFTILFLRSPKDFCNCLCIIAASKVDFLKNKVKNLCFSLIIDHFRYLTVHLVPLAFIFDKYLLSSDCQNSFLVLKV